MTYRKLITYSPFLLTLVVLAVGLFAPGLIHAEEPDTVAGWLYDVVLNFFGTLAGLSAAFLNYAVNQFVINFGGLVTGSGMGAAINNMWSIVRDFFNIVFIFAIIYLGFKMILGSDDSGTKRALVYLIIAALLVNFSLFISKFVVDFSNILAGEVAVAAFPAFVSSGGTPTAGTVDIGTNFFHMMQIPTTAKAPDQVITGDASEWGYVFGIALVYIIAIFAFAAGAVMLMIRYAALCIFMVLSPFMFIGWVLPQYASLMRKYWSGFLGRAFFAPAYIVLLYFSGAVIQASFGAGTGTSGAAIGNVFTGGGAAATVSGFGAGLGPFILSAVFMIMSVQVASKLSADGAGTAMRLGSNLANRGRRAAINTGLYAPRRVGQNAVALGGAGVTGATNLARRTRLGRFATNNTTGQALLNARNASKQVKLGASTTMRERDVARAAMQSQSQREVALRAAVGIDPNKPNLSQDERDKLAAAERAANDYGQKDIENMTPAQRAQITPYLKADTVGKLLDSDQLSSKEKGKIQGDYSAAIHDKIIENGEVVTDEISKLSIKQLEILGDQFVRDYAGFLSESQMDDLKKSQRFTEAQKGAHKGARKVMLETFGTGGTIEVTDPKNAKGKKIEINDTGKYLFRETKRNTDTGAIESGKALKAVELAARPVESFINPSTGQIRTEARQYVTADTLKQIARNSQQGKPTLSDAEREQLAEAVINTPGLNSRVYSYLTKEKAGEDFFINETQKTEAKKQEKLAKDDNAAIKDALGGNTLGT